MSATTTPDKNPATNANPSPAASAVGGIVRVNPYLMFDGRCDEAIEFYRRAVGAEVTMLMRFKDAPPAPPSADAGNCEPTPGTENKVMHASLRIGSTEVLASDGNCGNAPKFEGISLSLTVATAADANRLFTALSEGGQVQMPLTKTFFSDAFGMVADKFGVSWMVYVLPQAPK